MRQITASTLLALLVTLSMPLHVWANPLDLPLNDPKLTPAELAIQRYKRQRFALKVEGESWHVVQGINVDIPDEQLLALAGMPERVKAQRQKDFIGGAMTITGALAGVFGILALTQVVPLPDEWRIGVGIGSLAGGIGLAGIGEYMFPVMLPGDHYLSIEEARSAIDIINQRLKSDLGLPPDASEY